MEKIIDEENLMPVKENRAAYLTRKYGNVYNTNLFNKWFSRKAYKLVRKLLLHYVGRKFDDFFSDLSERCKHDEVLLKHKYDFERLIASDKTKCTRYSPYYLNDDGIILCGYKRTKSKCRGKRVNPKNWYEMQSILKLNQRKQEKTIYKFKHDETK